MLNSIGEAIDRNIMVRGIRIAGSTAALAVLSAVGGCHQSAGTTAANPEISRFETRQEAPVNSWWITTPDGGVVVFDALRTLSDAREAAVKIRATRRPVRAIFVTHPHPDHVTGLSVYRQAFPEAQIHMSADGVEYLHAKGRTLLEMNVKARDPGDATASIPSPDVIIRDGDKLEVGGLDVEVHLLGSGESPGTVVYHLPSVKMLVTGDVLTPRRTPLLAAGKTAEWLRQVEALAAFDRATRVLPGHGPATTLGEAANWQKLYIDTFRGAVMSAVQPSTSAGRCISADEAARVLRAVRAASPVEERVARMPAEALDQLNLAGVAAELGAGKCPGPANPIRE